MVDQLQKVRKRFFDWIYQYIMVHLGKSAFDFMKKATYLIILIVFVASIAYVFNLYTSNRDFELKQRCHDEAIKFMRDKVEAVKNMQLDFKDQGSPKVTYSMNSDLYNKTLNTCLQVVSKQDRQPTY